MAIRKVLSKLAQVLVVVVVTQVGVLGGGAQAASTPPCPISNWNVGGQSGGCTCYVAERLQKLRGKPAGTNLIPWGGNAGEWYARAQDNHWSVDANRPAADTIAAFDSHVAWVESVALTTTASVKHNETTTTGYRLVWRVVGSRKERRGSGRKAYTVAVPVYGFARDPVYKTTTYETRTDTYRVTALQKDYGKLPVRSSSWTAIKTTQLKNGQIISTVWTTPTFKDGPTTLLGYITPR